MADLLGHENATVTLTTYAHLWPTDLDRARDAVDSVFGPGRVRNGSNEVPDAR